MSRYPIIGNKKVIAIYKGDNNGRPVRVLQAYTKRGGIIQPLLSAECDVHTIGDIIYVWADDCSTCTAEAICKECSEKLTETATAEENITKEATCTETGEKTMKVTFSTQNFFGNIVECEHTHTIDIDANNHGEMKQELLDPTCTEKGYSRHTCIDCGYFTETELAALGHEWEDTTSDVNKTIIKNNISAFKAAGIDTTTENWTDGWRMSSVASCTERQAFSRSCKRANCNFSETVLVGSTTEHVFNVELAETEYKRSDATCKDPATYYYSCSCGLSSEGTDYEKYFSRGDKDPYTHPDEHYNTDYKAPTCTEPGYDSYYCSACGASGSGTIPAEGHAWVNGPESDPTCGSPGGYYRSCDKCGASQWNTTKPATGAHSMYSVTNDDESVTYYCHNCTYSFTS